MKTVSVSKARSRLYRLLDEAAESHDPVVITGKRHNGVMIGEEDWRAIQETLYLLSIPGMRKSILEGGKLPLSACRKRLDW